MQRPGNRRREESSSSPPCAQPRKIFLLYKSKGSWHTKQPIYRHFELRNRKSYQVGSVQGKEIEKSENIFSSNMSGIEIPNDKDYFSNSLCFIWTSNKEWEGYSSTGLLLATTCFQNCDLSRHSLPTPSIRGTRENFLGFWEELTFPA